eukprot:TRINITY_DN5450_c0_g1_i1.p1 TRINITY_DN5450_c0_g1~~TRINITY_DN5450_c0_g1_i1.p1  ORF type:complete len:245 (+),score=53.58 TRINITY_DN5450_c0_g1_i1:521-1255(+)
MSASSVLASPAKPARRPLFQAPSSSSIQPKAGWQTVSGNHSRRKAGVDSPPSVIQEFEPEVVVAQREVLSELNNQCSPILERDPDPPLSWDGVTSVGHLYERRMMTNLRELQHKLDESLEPVTVYQLKELLARVVREKPPVIMPLVGAVCLVVGLPEPRDWDDLKRVLMKPVALRKRMVHHCKDLDGRSLSRVKLLSRRVKGMDYYQLRCVNTVAKWLDAYEQAAVYRRDHNDKIRTFRDKFRQ